MGYISNSLGLISDAFHMLFDCTALLIGLVASYVAQVKKSDNEYTFGYIKIETLSGLFNGMFLIFIAFDILFESIGRIYEPQEINHDTGLLSVSVLGLLVNMVGLFFFHDHSHGGEPCTHNHAETAGGHHHHHEPVSQDDHHDGH